MRLDEDNFLPFRYKDVHDVFGTTKDGSSVTGVGNECSNGVREFARKCLGMASLEDDIVGACVRVIETKHASPMTELEKDAFALAFVCLIIFKLLVPVDLLDGLSAKFIPALVCRETIASHNWSQYVIDRILWSANLIRVNHKGPFVCKHVYPFLQIFYCDNTDFGKMNTSHTLFPRIKAFGNSTVRLLMCQDALPQDSDGIIQYVRRKARNDIESKSFSTEINDSVDQSPKGSLVSISKSDGDVTTNQESLSIKIVSRVARSDSIKKNIRPAVVMKFKRERAWFIKTMLALRRTVEKRMDNFCQEIIEILDSENNEGHNNSATTISKTLRKNSLAYMPNKDHTNRSRDFEVDFKEIEKDIGKSQVSSESSPLLDSVAQLVNWMLSSTEEELDRKWIIHSLPRLIELTGLRIRDEIIREADMSSDIFDAITRRYMQILNSSLHKGIMERMRYFMESDFAEKCLSGRHDFPNVLTQPTEYGTYSEMAHSNLTS
ncbi:hypothetical protein ACP70R_036646 [Stipagrostis hirtigluma subsp. patula]